jgi:cell wall-associated NlpC family hydrolase
MSPVTDVLSRIQDIQSQMQALRTGGASALLGGATGVSSTGSAASAGAFADALATSGTGTGTATGAGLGTGAASAAAASGGLATTASTAAVKGAVASGSGAVGPDVVEAAKKYLGVPYVFGGEDRTGMDCSGLVQTVFKDLGVTMPRVVPDQADMGAEVGSLAEAKPGDLLIPKGEGHVVIYLGDGKVLHAPRPGKDVQIVGNWYKDSDLATIRRIVPATATATAGIAPTTSVGAASSTASVDLMTAQLQRLMSSGVAS